MNRRLTIAAAVVSVIFSVYLAPHCAAQAARRADVRIENWGFMIQLPQSFVKTVPEQSEVKFLEIYSHKGLAYFAMVTETPMDVLTSTAIEQALQKMSKSGNAGRWETETRKRELFKGISRTVWLGEDTVTRTEFARDFLAGKAAFECLSMAPLKNESSPILTVGVIGPQEMRSTIETEAKFLAFTVAKIAANPPKQAKAPVAEPPAKPTRNPIRIAPPKRPTLKKGDIELLGKVESCDRQARKVIVSVAQVTMPGQSPVKLDPARSKTIFLKRIPKEVAAGVRLLVVGKNEGIGRPIVADFFEIPTDTPAPPKPAEPGPAEGPAQPDSVSVAG